MKVATWNVNSLRVRLDHLVRWLSEAEPDVVCLQETKVTDDAFPADAIRDAGYPHLAWYGQKTYNGVALLSRHPIEDVQEGFSRGPEDPQRRLVRGRVQGVDIFGCYVPNGSKVGSDKFAYKLRWYRRLRAELKATADLAGPVLVCGDFNVAREEQDCWDPFEAEGKLLFHPQERKAVKSLEKLGLADALRVVEPEGEAFTWWDYRGGGFQKNQGYRIDMHLISAPLQHRLREVRTWREVRGWEQPSDHVPVVCTFD